MRNELNLLKAVCGKWMYFWVCNRSTRVSISKTEETPNQVMLMVVETQPNIIYSASGERMGGLMALYLKTDTGVVLHDIVHTEHFLCEMKRQLICNHPVLQNYVHMVGQSVSVWHYNRREQSGLSNHSHLLYGLCLERNQIPADATIYKQTDSKLLGIDVVEDGGEFIAFMRFEKYEGSILLYASVDDNEDDIYQTTGEIQIRFKVSFPHVDVDSHAETQPIDASAEAWANYLGIEL